MRKKIILIAIILSLQFYIVKSQELNQHLGARSAGIANSSVMLSDVWSSFHNQAGLADIRNMTFGAYFENRFAIKELSLKAATFLLPINTGTFGFTYSYFGYTDYNENKFALAFAKRLWNIVNMGIQLDYFYTSIAEDYGQIGNLAGEVGLQVKPLQNLYFGVHVFNPTKSKITEIYDVRLPTVFRLGVGYSFVERLWLTTEAEKDITKETVFKAGLEFRLHRNIFIRTGLASNPQSFTFGIGYQLKGFNADFAFSNNPVLQYTTHVSMSYKFGWKVNTEEKKPEE